MRLPLQGSALSGAIARIPTHPIDTLKARLQTLRSSGAGTGKPLDTAPQLFVRIFREEGLRGLYRGLGVTLLLGPFASMLYFGGYEVSTACSNTRFGLVLPRAPSAQSL
jgi:solute carrier family 25 carnitine/acylcarnitine transporter 20/29